MPLLFQSTVRLLCRSISRLISNLYVFSCYFFISLFDSWEIKWTTITFQAHFDSKEIFLYFNRNGRQRRGCDCKKWTKAFANLPPDFAVRWRHVHAGDTPERRAPAEGRRTIQTAWCLKTVSVDVDRRWRCSNGLW